MLHLYILFLRKKIEKILEEEADSIEQLMNSINQQKDKRKKKLLSGVSKRKLG